MSHSTCKQFLAALAALYLPWSLGSITWTKFDEFLENFQTASDPLVASQIARIEGTALNPGKAQCEEITFVFGGGTRLTTLLELRAVPSFLANCRTWKFSADVVWDDFIRITFVLPSILANCPQFRQSDEAPKNGQF